MKFKPSHRRLATLALAAALAWSAPAAAEPPPVVTPQKIRIEGRTLAYTAEAGRTPIRDVATGQPLGHVFYVAYRAAPRPGQVRPVMFVWNGGPSLPAASLHFEGAGPRRIENGAMVDNADTWLTDADLVFMDPNATGFSRPVSREAQAAFTSWIGDVAATTEFVRAWLLTHGAEDAPVVIAGQSYGAGRAGATAHNLLKRGFKVRGLALISNTTGMPDYPERDVIALAIHVADYAVAAHYYRKLPAEFGTTPDAVRAQAEAWANQVYLPALRRRASLSPAEREDVRTQLARRIGLTPADIDPATLSITQGYFLGHLAPGKRLYYSDYRFTEPYVFPPLKAGVRYLRHDLGYATDLPYLGVETYEDGFAPDGIHPKPPGASWVHATVYGATAEQIGEAQAAFARTGAIGMGRYGPPLPAAKEAMDLEPRLKVFIAHGAYDPLGGCSMDAELGRRLNSPYREAVRVACYESGHAIYRDAPARALFAADMRRLARQAAGDAK